MKFLVFIGLFCGMETVYSQPHSSDRTVCSDTAFFQSNADMLWGGDVGCEGIDLKNHVFIPASLTIQPMFPGGTDSLRAWFQQNVRFPEGVDTILSENRTYAVVVIDNTGKLHVDTVVWKQLQVENGAVIDEIKRLLKIIPYFSPGICRRREIIFHTTLEGGATFTRLGPRVIDHKVRTQELMLFRFTTRENVRKHYSGPTDTTRTELIISLYKE